MVQPSRVFLFSGVLTLALAHGRGDVLEYGTPEQVGLLPLPLQLMVQNLSSYTKPGNYGVYNHNNSTNPIEPGGVTLVARDSVIVSEFAFGERSLYASVSGPNGTLLPELEREAATIDTIYDMASLTKMYTSIAALIQIDRGLIGFNTTVETYLPAFAVNCKENVTIRHLVTHTSGLQPDPVPGLYNETYKTYDQRVEAIMNQTLQFIPGTDYVYSDLNYMTLQLVLEKVTGSKLDMLIAEYTDKLGLNSTFFNRGNVEGPAFPYYGRIAPTEFEIEVLGNWEIKRPQPVHGTVHDENGWALDGVSGHAGLFSTVRDTARFCQMILNNGTYGGQRIVSQESIELIFTNWNTAIPDEPRGFGFELDTYSTAGPMASPQTASHTGFTGTSMVIDRPSNTFFIHLSNRVHPSRQWSSNIIVRKALGYWVAQSLGRNVTFPS